MSNKKGFAYYNIDTDRYQDLRIKRLKKDFGCTGIAVYDYILCEIYRVKGCFIMWDDSTAFDVSDYWGLKETTVNEIVNYCCNVGLFSKELRASENVLTSLSIQHRFTDMSTRAKRKDIIIPEKYRVLPEEIAKVPEEMMNLNEVLDKVKKSKEEKSINTDDRKAIFLKNEIWQEQFCMSKGVSIEVLKQLQKKFLADCDLRGEYVDSYQKYFVNAWNKGMIKMEGIKQMVR